MPADDLVPRRTLLRAGAASALAASAAVAGDPRPSRSDDSRRPGREVWIASLTLDGIDAGSREDCLRQVLARMEAVAAWKPDLVCLPEIFNARFRPRPSVVQQGEPIDGPTIAAMSKFARSNRCYVVAPITLKRDGKLFNTAVLLGRDGMVVGTYDKIHPTEPEMKAGITPGRGAPVFATDFGRLGLQICFDIDWPDGWKLLKDGGAELVVWPSAYPGGFPLNSWAWTHRYPIVTSPWTNPAALIDLDGRTLAKSGTWEPWLVTSFCLDRGLFHLDDHQKKIRDLEKAYGRDVTVRFLHDEGAFVLENRIPGRTLADLMSEFGLITMDQYLARAGAAQDRARG